MLCVLYKSNHAISQILPISLLILFLPGACVSAKKYRKVLQQTAQKEKQLTYLEKKQKARITELQLLRDSAALLNNLKP
jgi:hypothetical protein